MQATNFQNPKTVNICDVLIIVSKMPKIALEIIQMEHFTMCILPGYRKFYAFQKKNISTKNCAVLHPHTINYDDE